MLRTGWYLPVDPPENCAHLLLCAWTAVPSGSHILVPDACCDLLWLSTGRLVFCGPETRAWSFELPAGTTAVGVRFRPGVPAVVFDLDLATLREQRTEAAQVMGQPRAAEWIRRIAAGESLDERRDIMIELLAEAYAEQQPDPFAEAVLARLGVRPRADVAELAAVLSVHPRTLHRHCLRLFGYGPATLARLIRLQRFIAHAATAPHPSLARLAADAGYVDQAHLGRECRRVTGRTPTAYLHEYFATFPDMSDPYKSGRDLTASMEA